MKYTRLLEATCLLQIWNPDLMNFIDEPARRRQMRLLYRAKGIVLHDRALNGEPLERSKA